jgi:spore maturation protein CgeB
MKTLRILTSGESWFGATGRGYNWSLRELGHDVDEVNIDHYLPQWRWKPYRGLLRLLTPIAVQEFNDALMRRVQVFKPEIFLAFKGPYVLRASLRKMHSLGITLYNYYQETSVFAHGSYIPEALQEYDCVFHSKQFFITDTRGRLDIKQSYYLNHGYDSDLSKVWPLTESDREQFGVDVAVIGNWTSHKERLLNQILELRPRLQLAIWGNRWENCQSESVSRCWRRAQLVGQQYSRALQAAKINLAITSGIVPGASRGDMTTGRTFQIPACGGFMLHERNHEVLDLYLEGKEIECYDSAAEAVEKIDHYLAHPAERTAVAAAGYQRCVPAYSDTSRLKELLAWHEQRTTAGAVSR